MTNCTAILGTATALILTVGANADLQYGEAVLSAESNCFTGAHHDLVQQSVSFAGEYLEASSSCGGGSTGAYLDTNADWFILSAGSTIPGQQSSGKETVPVITDGGNGTGAVEVEFTVDGPTLFRMQRCQPGTTVKFWDGKDQIASLDSADGVTQLPQGTYWATIETDEYGTPMWAQVDWSQQEDQDPADINGDGKVNTLDLVELMQKMSEQKGSDKNHPTGGKCTAAAGKGKGGVKDISSGYTPMPKPKPAQSKRKSGGKEAQLDDNGDIYGAHMSQMKGRADGKESKFDDNGEIFGAHMSRMKGDFDQSGKIDMTDVIYLLKRL
jgi:hypothetical protein